MKEYEWYGSQNPVAMLRWLDGVAEPAPEWANLSPGFSARKRRLFAVACVRGFHWLLAPKALEVLAEVEDFAGVWCAGLVGANAKALQLALSAPDSERADVAEAIRQLAVANISPLLVLSLLPVGMDAHFANILRQMVQPFRPLTLKPEWVTSSVLALAHGAYEERRPDASIDPDRLGILSDALEEAGYVGTCNACEGDGEVDTGYVRHTEDGPDDTRRRIKCAWCRGTGRGYPLLVRLRSIGVGESWRGMHELDVILGRE